MIKYQHKSLVYRHINFTDNHMLSVLVYALLSVNKPIIWKDIDKKSMLYTGCIQRVAHGVYTCNQILFMYLCDNFIQMTSKVILVIVLYNDMRVLTVWNYLLGRVLTIIYLHTV